MNFRIGQKCKVRIRRKHRDKPFWVEGEIRGFGTKKGKPSADVRFECDRGYVYANSFYLTKIKPSSDLD